MSKIDETFVSESSNSDSELNLEVARQRCNEAIREGFNSDELALIEALPAMGKSRGVIEYAAETGRPVTVFTARYDQFEQLKEWCEERKLRYKEVRSLYKACETANGDHGGSWEGRIEEAHKAGFSPSEIHRRATAIFGEELPCKSHCSYLNEITFEPEEFDVIIAHYKFANWPKLVAGRDVAIDEFPEENYSTEYKATTVNQATSDYLSRHPELGFRDVTDLRERRHNPEIRANAESWFRDNDPDLRHDSAALIKHPAGRSHPEGATMVYATLTAKQLDNGWEFASLPGDRRAAICRASGAMTVLSPPDLSSAASVIALDGTPTVERWEIVLGMGLQQIPTLTDEEKGQYLKNVLRNKVIQTTGVANHCMSGIGATPPKDVLLFEAVKDREGVKPDLLTSRAALKKYESHGVTDVVGKIQHFGNIKGTNEFESTRVGIVAGSPHLGDNYVEKWSALAGESADRDKKRDKGMEQRFGEFGDKILYGMREMEVLQAILRFGRDGGGATVYVHTAAIPGWIERSESLPHIHVWRGKKDGMRQVIDAIRKLGKSDFRTKDVSEVLSR